MCNIKKCFKWESVGNVSETCNISTEKTVRCVQKHDNETEKDYNRRNSSSSSSSSDSNEAVSYTHLDVYKRQELDCGR